MGVAAVLVLLFLGIILSLIGSIIGVVDAFRVSTVWGLLALFVPFALLVYWIKFWRGRKWARNSLIISLLGLGATLISIPLAGGIGALMARNSVEDEFSTEPIPIPTDPNAVPGTPEDGVVEVPAEGEDELFQEAMLPGLPTAAEIARAELLPSTDPNERVKEIERERNDPYAIVTIPPIAPPNPPAPATAPGAGGNAAPNNLPQPTTATNQPPTAPGGAAQPGGTAGTPGGVDPNAPLPDLPEPTVVASQVEISGVASVNGDTYAIVKAPGEATSRYVKVGDRLSNGTVLVKRIENRSGGAPVVVLEERGEEIALPVGANVGPAEEPTAMPPTSTPVASLPIPNLN